MICFIGMAWLIRCSRRARRPRSHHTPSAAISFLSQHTSASHFSAVSGAKPSLSPTFNCGLRRLIGYVDSHLGAHREAYEKVGAENEMLSKLDPKKCSSLPRIPTLPKRKSSTIKCSSIDDEERRTPQPIVCLKIKLASLI